MQAVRRAIRHTLAFLSLTAVVAGCDTAAPGQAYTDGFTISVPAGPAPVGTPGGTVSLPVTVTRVNGYTGVVVLSLNASTQYSADPVLVAENETSGILVVHVAASVAPGNRSVVINANGPPNSQTTISSIGYTFGIANPGTFSLSAPTTILSIKPGQTTHMPVTIARVGYTGAVTVGVASLTAPNVTYVITQPGTGDLADIAFTEASDGPINTSTQFTVTATGVGVDGTAQLTAFMQEIPFGYTLSISPNPVGANPGSVVPLTITATREAGNTAPIVVSLGIVGADFTATPVTITSTQAVLNVTVSPNASPRLETSFQVVGTQPTYATSSQSAFIPFQVTAPTTNVRYTFCPATGLPLFVAIQDGSALWALVPQTNGSYPFTISAARGGIAYVTQVGGITTMNIFWGIKAELIAQGNALCPRAGATSTVTSSVSNIAPANQVDLSIGAAIAFVRPATNANFTLNNVAPGPLDVTASSFDATPTPHLVSKMFLRRAVDPAATLAALDFSSATEAFTPTTSTLTFANSGGEFVNVLYYLHTLNTDLGEYYSDGKTATTFSFFGLPAAKMIAGDVHYATGTALVGNGPVRTAGVMFGAVADQTITFGPALSVPTISTLFTFPFPQFQAVLPLQPEYSKLYEADFVQSTGSNHTLIMQATGGYVTAGGAASSVTLTMPDLRFLQGWNNAWAPVSGFATHWTVTGSMWSAAAGITTSPFAVGNTTSSASQQGDVTP